jgi:O-antigen/teichoic acid export membrane protein
MIQVMYSIDTVLLGFLRTDAEVGYYNAAYKIILFVISVGAVYFDAIFPLASNYFERSLDSLKTLQRHTAKLMVSVACPMALGGLVLAGPIMRFFYGQRYDSGIIAFQILIWAAAFIYLNMIYARGMWACNLRKAFVRIVTFQAVLNIVLNLVLIPRYGIAGAAISTLISEFCGLYFYYKEFNRVVRVEFYDFLLRPMIAAGLMSGILILFPDLNLFLRLLGGFIVYAALLYVLKGVTSEDVRLLKAVLPMKNG